MNKYDEWADQAEEIKKEMGWYPSFEMPRDEEQYKVHERVREMLLNAIIGLQDLARRQDRHLVEGPLLRLGGLTEEEEQMILEKRKAPKKIQDIHKWDE